MLWNPKISGHSLKQLKPLSKLKILGLRKTNIRDGAFQVLLNCLLWKSCDLSETHLSLKDFQKLAALQQIKKLTLKNLANPNINEEHFDQLERSVHIVKSQNDGREDSIHLRESGGKFFLLYVSIQLTPSRMLREQSEDIFHAKMRIRRIKIF